LYKQLKESHKSTNQIWENISGVLNRNPWRIRDRFIGILNPTRSTLESEWSEEENRTFNEEFEKYLLASQDWDNNSHYMKKAPIFVNQKDRIKKLKGTRDEGKALITNSMASVNSLSGKNSVEILKNIMVEPLPLENCVANSAATPNILTNSGLEESSSALSLFSVTFDDDFFKELDLDLFSALDYVEEHGLKDQESIHGQTYVNHTEDLFAPITFP
jgi:hypothetical protein